MSLLRREPGRQSIRDVLLEGHSPVNGGDAVGEEEDLVGVDFLGDFASEFVRSDELGLGQPSHEGPVPSERI